MNCANCGAPLAEGAQFCPKCGVELDTPNPTLTWTQRLIGDAAVRGGMGWLYFALFLGSVLGIVYLVNPSALQLVDDHTGIWTTMDNMAFRTGIAPEWVLVLSVAATLLALVLALSALKYLSTPHK